MLLKDIQIKKPKISTMYQHKCPNLLILLKDILSKRPTIFIDFFVDAWVFCHCQNKSAKGNHTLKHIQRKKGEQKLGKVVRE